MNPIFENKQNNLMEMVNNPQVQALLKLYNGDAKAAFYALCKQKGIDPESILKSLR